MHTPLSNKFLTLMLVLRRDSRYVMLEDVGCRNDLQVANCLRTDRYRQALNSL